MERIETSIVINRPLHEVWAFLDDPANAVQWESGVQESEKTSEGPMGVGSTVREVRKFLGRQIESTWEVTEYEPNKRVGFKSTSGPIPFHGTQTFESVEGATKITQVLEAEPGGFFKLAEPLVARMFKRQVEADFGNLKELLEAQAEGSA